MKRFLWLHTMMIIQSVVAMDQQSEFAAVAAFVGEEHSWMEWRKKRPLGHLASSRFSIYTAKSDAATGGEASMAESDAPPAKRKADEFSYSPHDSLRGVIRHGRTAAFVRYAACKRKSSMVASAIARASSSADGRITGRYVQHRLADVADDIQIGPFVCPWPDCVGFEFESEKLLSAHVREEHNPKQAADGFFVCPISCACNTKPGIHELVTHLRGAHEMGNCPYLCKQCGRRWNQPGACKNHIEAAHHHLKKFVCPVCEKQFGYSADLLKHKKRLNHY